VASRFVEYPMQITLIGAVAETALGDGPLLV
jgi:hypothetical protein